MQKFHQNVNIHNPGTAMISKSINDIAIVPTQVGGSEIQTINARELHEFLDSKQDFSTWIKNRIKQYNFLQDIDFIRFHNFKESNDNRTLEYHISLDMAKQLCMVERNTKGKEARFYFIECERRLKESQKTLSALDILAQQVAILQKQEREMLAVKQTQNEHAVKIHEIESKVMTTNSDFYTISGYASLQGIKLNMRQAGVLGKQCVKLSNQYNYHIGEIKDERFGKVNIYHIDILAETFKKKYGFP